MLCAITAPGVGGLYAKGDKLTLSSTAGLTAVCMDRDGTEVQKSLQDAPQPLRLHIV